MFEVVCISLMVAGFVLLALAVAKERKASRRMHAIEREEQELLDRLASGLAHELRNPLGALALNLQLLEEELSSSGVFADASAKRLAMVMKESRRLEDVLDTFLRYARNRPPALSDISVNDLVGEVLTFLKPEILRAGVEVVWDGDEAVPHCRADAGLVKQALFNVIINSVEAMPQGGTLSIVTEGRPSGVAVRVSDTGVGIAPEDLPRIFDAYFSGKKSGTGLGLSITRRIIERHGGSIDVESAPGSGTSVTMTIPDVEESAAT